MLRTSGESHRPKRIRTFVLAAFATLAAAPAAQAEIPSQATERSSAEVRAYWTAERMREAIPADRPFGSVAIPQAPLAGDDIGERSVVGPVDQAVRGILGGGGGGGREAKEIENPRRAPFRTHGKVYFTLGMLDYVCSGTVVNSEVRRLVVTAGHCVYSQVDGFADRWIFVPGFDEGAKPYGRWVAGDLATTPQWRQSEDIRYDVGMATMRKRNGKRLQSVVGARGIGFNLRPERYHAYGYPAEDPYNGRQLRMCNSRDQGADQNEGNPKPRRIDCDMTGGSSGGGWVVRERLVNSVVSYGYECVVIILPCNNPDRGKLFGPYFGDTIKRLYRSQQRR